MCLTSLRFVHFTNYSTPILTLRSIRHLHPRIHQVILIDEPCLSRPITIRRLLSKTPERGLRRLRARCIIDLEDLRPRVLEPHRLGRQARDPVDAVRDADQGAEVCV